MAITIPLSVTGGAQTGFTAPTYTTVVDTPPDISAKQNVVTALGGTQAGVTAHSVASPFTLTVWRPKALKVLPAVNPITGVLGSVPKNVYSVITRKGVLPLANQPFETFTIESRLAMPAGADTADIANCRAAISAHIGMLNGISAGLGDTVQNGVL